MESGQRSIFSSAVRAFFSAMFGILGVFVAILAILIVVGILFSSDKKEANIKGHYTMIPDAKGVKRSLQSDSPLILYVDLAGIMGDVGLNGDEVREQFELSRQRTLGDQRIRAVLLAINSPGGSVFAADRIYRIVKEYRNRYQVPIYVHVDGICASGGYYVASAANKTYATSASLLGSIGVLMNFINFHDTLDKIGVKTLTLTKGKDKDAMSTVRPWKEGEEKEMDRLCGYYYNMFLNIVLAARPALSRDMLVNELGARVFPGPEAMSLGMIDGIAETRSEVIEMLAKEAGIADERYQVIQLTSQTWLDKLLDGSSFLFNGEIKHQLELPGHLEKALPTGLLYLYEPGVSYST